jgi:hypothetical protein
VLAVDLAFWIVVIFLVGLVGFFVMAVVLVLRLIGYVLRALFGHRSIEEKPAAPRAHMRGRVCLQPGCGHVNASAARYCARCGQRLGALCDVDAYG